MTTVLLCQLKRNCRGKLARVFVRETRELYKASATNIYGACLLCAEGLEVIEPVSGQEAA